MAGANLTAAMRDLGIATYEEFHRWSVADRGAFWKDTVERLGIVWREPPHHVLDPDGSVEAPQWLAGARANIAESCFHHDPAAAAVVYSRRGEINSLSRQDLRKLVLRFARGFAAADSARATLSLSSCRMTVEAVAAYLGIVWAGGVVVSIADSFAPDEIARRLRITGATTVVTQDVVRRSGKELPMYAKVVEAGARLAIVVETGADSVLRSADIAWEDFLGGNDYLDPVITGPRICHEHPFLLRYDRRTQGHPVDAAHAHQSGDGRLLPPGRAAHRRRRLAHEPRLDDGSLGSSMPRSSTARRWRSTTTCPPRRALGDSSRTPA